MSPACRLVSALLRNHSGNILPLAAAAIFAIAALIGGAVDISRAWRAQTRLQAACDAAVLAGRKAVTTAGFDATAEAMADNYFLANFEEEQFAAKNTAFDATSADRGGTVDGAAVSYLPPLLMHLFGFEDMALTTQCSASMGVGNSDIMMVLDTTGSMTSLLSGSTQTRMQALRASMKSFYDTVETAVSGTNARVRYGFVPYSSSVNVGRLLLDLNPQYLIDSWTIQSRNPIYKSVQTLTGYDTPSTGASSTSTTDATYSSWQNYNATAYSTNESCSSNKPADTAWTNTGTAVTTSAATINGSGQQVVTTTTTQPQTARLYGCNSAKSLYRLQYRTGLRNAVTTTISTANAIYTTTQVFDKWEYRPVTYDTSRFKLFEAVSTKTGISAAAVSSTWNGCIEERSTVSEDSFSWSSINGFTPEGAEDLDIDSPPDGSPGTKWAPMWPDVAYIRTLVSNGTVYLNSALPSSSGQQAASYCPSAAQLLSTMNRAAFYAVADGLVAKGATYHDMGMAWGARLISPDGMWSERVREPPGNGGEVSRS